LIIDKNSRALNEPFLSSKIILKYKVENLVAQCLLEGTLQKGQKLVIKGEDIQ